MTLTAKSAVMSSSGSMSMGIEFRNRKEIDAIVRDERYIYTFSDTRFRKKKNMI